MLATNQLTGRWQGRWQGRSSEVQWLRHAAGTRIEKQLFIESSMLGTFACQVARGFGAFAGFVAVGCMQHRPANPDDAVAT